MNRDATAWLAVVGAILAAFMSVMDIQITNVAIQQIQSAMSATLEEGSWITSSYLIAEISVIPLTRIFTGRFGASNMVVACCAAFTVASVLCAQAWDLNSLIAFRALQGLSGGMLMPLAYVMIMTRLDAKDHVRAMSLFGVASSSAPAIGPGLAGLLVDRFGWQMIFYAGIPIAVLAASCVLYAGHASQRAAAAPARTTSPSASSTDYLGLASAVVGLACLVFIIEEGHRKDWFESGLIRALAFISSASLTVFVARALTHPNPLVDIRLLARRRFGLACATSFLGGFTLFGCLFLIPYFLTVIHGYSALEVSRVILWMAIPQIFISLTIPHVLRRMDIHVVIATGFLVFAASCVWCASLSSDFAGPQFSTPLLLRAMGLPMVMIALGLYAMAGIDKHDSASASVLLNISRSIGGALGVAFMTTWVNLKQSAFLQESLAQLDAAKVSDYHAMVQAAPDTPRFAQVPHDPLESQAAGALSASMERLSADAFVNAFNDAFHLMSIALLVAGSLFALLFVQQSARAGTYAWGLSFRRAPPRA